MTVYSAALIPYRIADDEVLEVFIAHMGGPFWAKKDQGGWSVVKGEFDPQVEVASDVAAREFEEEIGRPAPSGTPAFIGEYKQPSGKVITAFAVETDENLEFIESNVFSMEWPKGSGKLANFSEVDRAEWFTVDDARPKLLKGHHAMIDQLFAMVLERRPQVLGGRETTLF